MKSINRYIIYAIIILIIIGGIYWYKHKSNYDINSCVSNCAMYTHPSLCIDRCYDNRPTPPSGIKAMCTTACIKKFGSNNSKEVNDCVKQCIMVSS